MIFVIRPTLNRLNMSGPPEKESQAAWPGRSPATQPSVTSLPTRAGDALRGRVLTQPGAFTGAVSLHTK